MIFDIAVFGPPYYNNSVLKRAENTTAMVKQPLGKKSLKKVNLAMTVARPKCLLFALAGPFRARRVGVTYE